MNSETPIHVVCNDLHEYVSRQLAEIMGDVNGWFAGEHFGHSPTKTERVQQYFDNGGPADFAKRHVLRDVPQS